MRNKTLHLYFLLSICCCQGSMANVMMLAGIKLIAPPVELTSFKVRYIEPSQVQLTWTTATEKNSQYFTVERSLWGEEWEPFDTINAAGNSATKIFYEVIDEHPYHQLSYYRVKEVDLEGKSKYYPVVACEMRKTGYEALEIYPNPTGGIVQVLASSAELESLSIYDMLARPLDQGLVHRISSERLSIDLTAQPSGIYILKTNSFSAKLIKK
jgi:hypothetical protein